jgi:hypothetical protein
VVETTLNQVVETLLQKTPELSTLLTAVYQLSLECRDGVFYTRIIANRLQRWDTWVYQQPRQLARLGLLRKVGESEHGRCAHYVVTDRVSLGTALIAAGVNPRLELPGDFFHRAAAIA